MPRIVGLMFTILLLCQAAAPAAAQDADQLAQLIQTNLEDVAVQLRVAPAQAREDLERQREELATLRRQAPDHPLLSSLERRLGELDTEVAAAEASGPAAGGDDVTIPLDAPAEVRDQLRDVEALQTRADRELMGGSPERAEEYLGEAERMIKAIADEYGDRIPPGYARLIIADERQSALREQLERPAEE